MTTKLGRPIDLLTGAPNNSFAVNPLGIYHSELGFYLQKLEFSMDRMLELQTIQSMRKMMMIQEQIFKQQVQELHRLYNLQKNLMQELENGLIKRSPKAKTGTCNPMFSVWHQTATEPGHNFHAFITGDDPKELPGVYSGDNSSRITPIKFGFHDDHEDLKTLNEENDVELELTLGIKHSTRIERSKNDYDQPNSGDPSSSINNSSTTVCQESTRPHWLLQDLSLSRT